MTLVSQLHEPAAEVHIDQIELTALVSGGNAELAFEEAFEEGDELFEAQFNAVDGGGANVGDGSRYTRVPRADLTGPGQWADHVPARSTGPNAAACNQCHNVPFDDGAGSPATDAHRDPLHTGNVSTMIRRDTPHLFAIGALQVAAEEMTEELQGIRDALVAEAQASPGLKTAQLVTKGVDYGQLRARRSGNSTQVRLDFRGLEGIDQDLVVKPFQWKGTDATLRGFVRGAAHNELGMQPVEMSGDGVDGDGDGVIDEMTVGDVTGITIYNAAQPRPVTQLELNDLGLIPALGQAEIDQINDGEALFGSIGCADCHKPSLTIDDPVYHEPSQNPNYRDAVMPAGQDPLAVGLDPANPVSFDLTEDQPDNVFLIDGQTVHLGALKLANGGPAALLELYGDMKRHDMGPGMAEAIDEGGTGASVFMTENLWGVGSTAPYLHDGRATTLTEAILEHGGDGAGSRAAFTGLSTSQQEAVLAFLNNLVLFKEAE